jgi:ADP-ribose diphosphatase
MTTRRTPLYRGRVIDLELERCTLPNGLETQLEIVRHPGGAAAVALDAQRRVCLLHQYRHAAGGWLWELPAGKMDPGEGPLVTARRELAEEAGMEAGDWLSLGLMHSSPGVFTEIIHLFLARDLRPCGQSLGHDELLEVHWLPLAEALEWAVSGQITDAKTLIGLFRSAAGPAAPEGRSGVPAEGGQ